MSSVINFLGAALILLTSLAACEPPVREVERGDVVNLYSNQLSASDQELFAPFERASGLKVNIIFRPGGKIIERINELGDDSTNADILLLQGVGNLHQAKEDGLLDTLPNSSFFNAVPAQLRDMDQQWLSLGYSAYAIAYRRDSVDTLQVQTYQQLADTAWQDKLLLLEKKEAYTSLLASMLAEEDRGTIQDWWTQLLENRSTQADSLAWLRLTHTAAYRPDPEWGLLFPRPQTYLEVVVVGIREQAPHPVRAEALFNYLFSRVFISRFTEKYRYYPSRADIQASDALPSPAEFQADTTAQNRIARFTKEADALLRDEAMP